MASSWLEPLAVEVHPLRRFLITSSLTLMLGAVLPARAELVVEDTIWGVDGCACEYNGQFELISIRLRNSGQQPLVGELSLTSGTLLGKPRPPRYIQPLHLSPGSTRWVQFTVGEAVFGQGKMWTLALARDGLDLSQRLQVPAPADSRQRAIWIQPSDDNFAKQLPGTTPFPEVLFPRSIVTLGRIDRIVLDRSPDWNAAQVGALHDYVRAGGELHLLRTDEAVYPQLPSPFKDVPGEPGREAYGAGWIIRHAVSRREVEPDHFASWSKNLGSRYPIVSNMDDSLVIGVSQEARPRPNEFGIGLAALVLIWVLGPGHFIFARKRDRPLLSRVYFWAALVVGSLLFLWLGLIGGRAAPGTQVVSYALVLQEDRVELRQWGCLSVLTGGEYRLTSHSPGVVVAPALPPSYLPNLDPLMSQVEQAWEADLWHFSIPMPILSFTPFLAHGVCEVETPRIEPLGPWTGNGTRFRIGGLPAAPRQSQIWIVAGDRIHALHADEQLPGEYVTRPATSFDYPSTTSKFERRTKPQSDKGLAEALMAYGLTLNRRSGLVSPADLLDVFVYTAAPPQWTKFSSLPGHAGKLLYHFRLPIEGL